MKFLLTCFSAVMALQLVSALAILEPEASECKTSNECDAGMCCVVSNPFIMSKRQLVLPSIIDISLYTSGKCKPYVREGNDCFSAGFGSCGCEPGTSCVKVAELEVPVQQLPKQEKMLIFRPPGVYNCVRV